MEDELVLELKAVTEISKVHEAQILIYMKLTGIQHGFILNFNTYGMKDGIRSFVL